MENNYKSSISVFDGAKISHNANVDIGNISVEQSSKMDSTDSTTSNNTKISIGCNSNIKGKLKIGNISTGNQFSFDMKNTTQEKYYNSK